MSRLALVSNFDDENLEKIKKTLVQIKEKMCRIPCIDGLERKLIKDLPFHFTMYSWDKNDEKQVLEFLTKFEFFSSNVYVTGVQIMNGRNNSYVLYYDLKVDDVILRMLEEFNNNFKNSKYVDYKFHITICISKDYERIVKYKEIIERDFVKFTLAVKSYSIYEIYPAHKIMDFNCK